MLFKIFYCDDINSAYAVLEQYQNNEYADCGMYDRSACKKFIFEQNDGDFVNGRIRIYNDDSCVYADNARYWCNYIVKFEDGTVIYLIRDYSAGEMSLRNMEALEKFVNQMNEKLNQTTPLLLQDEPEDCFVV